MSKIFFPSISGQSTRSSCQELYYWIIFFFREAHKKTNSIFGISKFLLIKTKIRSWKFIFCLSIDESAFLFLFNIFIQLQSIMNDFFSFGYFYLSRNFRLGYFYSNRKFFSSPISIQVEIFFSHVIPTQLENGFALAIFIRIEIEFSFGYIHSTANWFFLWLYSFNAKLISLFLWLFIFDLSSECDIRSIFSFYSNEKFEWFPTLPRNPKPASPHPIKVPGSPHQGSHKSATGRKLLSPRAAWATIPSNKIIISNYPMQCFFSIWY